MDKQEKWGRYRLRFIGLCFLLAFVLISVRAFSIQVLNQEEWRKRAERQHQKVISLAPKRGAIFDAHGEEMALSVEVDSIYVDARKVVDLNGEAQALAKALTLPVAAVKAKLSSGKSFIWLKRRVSPKESDKVKELKLACVDFIKEHRRYYPNAEIGAQVIGFAGLDPEGLEGVELRYDAMILGQSGYLVTEKDALGRGMGAGVQPLQEQSQGYNVYLTLDKNLQYIAEKELAAGIAAVQGKSGSVVVIDPETGRVLAMASQPDYNPNSFFNYKPAQWRNRAITDAFEPGSTFKVFLIAAALNEGVIKASQKIDCENGKLAVGGKVIHDHRPYGKLQVDEILKFSSNVGSAKIGKALERDNYYRYIRDFGFGEQTGIDLPGEAGGLIRKPSDWFEIDLAAISFGQGLSVTPIQLAAATAAIANGGYLMKPYVVDKVVDTNGQVIKKNSPRVVRQVVSNDVANRVRQMMGQVTEEGGTGTMAAVPGYHVGGKTGTAQKVDPVTGGYSADKRVSSFVGLVPVDDPRLVILVVVDEPEGKAYGGLVAAPIFSRIAAKSLHYLKVPATASTYVASTPPSVEVSAFPLNKNLKAAWNENGHEGVRMPDCQGQSYRQVLQTMERTGLNIQLRGSGRVVEQSPRPGEPIRYEQEVWVKLAPPA